MIRPAREQDAASIARLATQLGYPVSEDEIKSRLRRLLANSNDIVLVAESNALLAGWIHGVVSQLLESDLRIEIGGLVVDENFRRQGIGCDLVHLVEQWALEKGIKQISVRCNSKRLEAHQFYQKLGYRSAKTQTAFRKQL
jgi:GNAT superfamily N-acetyltransferase